MTFHLHIVSLAGRIFSGSVARVIAVGALGELEIAPKHAPLLTRLNPGPVRLVLQDGKSEIIYVTGGILEVQPELVTILADTVVRAKDFDEAQALQAKAHAESYLKDKHTAMEYAQARADLMRAIGMLKAISKIRYHQ